MSGACTRGSPRNLGRLRAFLLESRQGAPAKQKPRARAGSAPPRRERTRSAQEVRLSEGNEARPDEARGVGVPHTSEDAGEPTRGTPPSEGRHRVMEPLEGKMAEPQSSVDVSTKLERVAKLAREAPDMAFRSLA